MNRGAGGMDLREDKSAREALTRILAIESRNALARVELAASELSRFESTPAADDRISTIHQAVDQIDDLLAKIDLLASPAEQTHWTPVDVGAVWQRIRSRLDPTLTARGIRFQPDGDSSPAGMTNRVGGPAATGLWVEMPEAALESILFGLLRVVLGATDRDQALRFELDQAPNGFCAALVVVSAANHRIRFEIDREDGFELEVLLAEWGGTLTVEAEEDHDRVEFFLPTGSRDA